jgi:hypothetical protein
LLPLGVNHISNLDPSLPLIGGIIVMLSINLPFCRVPLEKLNVVDPDKFPLLYGVMTLVGAYDADVVVAE